jgi:hypothetical protein
VKTPEEMKSELDEKEISDVLNSYGGRPHEPFEARGCPLEVSGRDPEEYVSWWTEATRGLEDSSKGSLAAAEVVREGPKRIFYDSVKGLVPVYEGTQNVKVPIFHRKPDGHLGGIDA